MSGHVVPLVGPDPKPMTIEELWAEAEQFGAIYIHSQVDTPPPARYHCKITFSTKPGQSLAACSGYRVTIVDALSQAIVEAKKIVAQFKEDK